jgi:hypothetical protein
VKGHDFQTPGDRPWHQSLQVHGERYARLWAISPTYGTVTVIMVDEPGADQFYLLCLETASSVPRLMRAWKRRSWIEHCFRTLKHLLATGACQGHREEAYYGHLVLRLMGWLDTGGEFLGRDANQSERSAMIGHLNRCRLV